MRKRQEDIEGALRWAYVDELPKRGKASLQTGRGSNFDVVTRYGELGTVIDEAMTEPGFPGELGDPHPDALVIEEAVNSLADITDAAYDEAMGIADDMGFGLDEQRALAWALPQMRGFVITHAIQRNRPECRDFPVPGRVQAPNSNLPLVQRVENTYAKDDREGQHPYRAAVPSPSVGKKGELPVYKRGSFCPLAWYPDPESILLDRAAYVVWWSALDLLASELQGQLESIDVTGPAAPMRPWTGEVDKREARRVLPDLYSIERLRQDRINALAARLFAHSRRRRRAA